MPIKALITLILGSVLAFAPDKAPELDVQHRAAHHITFANALEGDSCSATAVGPHTLLTAGHCLLAANQIKIDGAPAQVVNYVFDDADHMLVITDATFGDWLRVDQTALESIEVGAPVHFWGNPGHSTDVYRIGKFKKWANSNNVKLAIFELPCYEGDSGSGILNESGAIIAVLSLGDQSAEAAVLPLQFSSAQLGQIK